MKRIVSIILVLSFMVALCLFVTIPAFATDPTPTPTLPHAEEYWENPEVLWHESGCRMLWLALQSFGIDVQYGEVLEWSEEVYDLLNDLVIQYLDSLPSLMSIYAWTQPWLWSDDFWGNVRFNESMLDDIDAFAQWLKSTFGLDDNDTLIIRPIYNVNGYTLYNIGANYQVFELDGTVSDMYMAYEAYDYDPQLSSANVQGYINYIIMENGVPKSYISPLSYSNGTYRLGQYLYNYNGIVVSSTASSISQFSGPNNNELYYLNGVQLSGLGQYMLGGTNPVFQNTNERNAFLQGAQIQRDGYARFVTSTINLPSTDPAYTPGDSMTIVDGEPQYSVIDWSGEVTVSNLPAVVSTGHIRDIGLIDAFRPITSLVSAYSDTMNLVVTIAYELPVEIWLLALAVMGGTIVFGVIKIMREH